LLLNCSLALAMPPPPADTPPMVAAALQASQLPGRGSRAASPYSLAFADADVAAVADEILGVELKAPFLIDPGVTGKISFRVDRRMTREQLLESFETALALSDIALVRTSGRVILMPRAKARTVAPFRRLSSTRDIVLPGYQTVSVPVLFVSPSDAAKSVQSANSTMSIEPDDQAGAVVLAGSSGEIRSALDTLRSVDRNQLSRDLVRTVVLKAATASAVASELTRLLAASGASGVTVVPIDRLDELIVTAHSDAVLDEAEAWVGRLDVPSHEEKYALWVYHPQNVTADALAQALNNLLSPRGTGRTQSSPTEPLEAANAPPQPPEAAPSIAQQGPAEEDSATLSADPDLRVAVEKETNSLIVMAPHSRWMTLRAVLEQIDQQPPQILIEATVLEVTLSHDFQTGVNWSILGSGGLNVTSTQINSATAPSQLALTFMNNSVQVAIDALASRTNVQVVSAPKLVAVDNQTATLEVGDEVPIINQTAQSTSAPGAPIVANTEYKDTGIILKIKPRINGPNSVLVDFSQEVSSVVPTTTSTINSPTIQQRRFESQMTLNEGETVAVGGLISSNKSLTDQGWPFIKDIPVVGLLFKSQNKTNDRTEIIVLLSAHILRTTEESNSALGRLESEAPSTKGLDHAP
jgi:general secretion pathway protein D